MKIIILFFVIFFVIEAEAFDINSHPFFSKFIPPKTKTRDSQLLKEKIIKQNETLIPVVIIPSLIGNKFESEAINSSPPHWYCDKNVDWYTIWLNTDEFYPFAFDCFAYNMFLYRNSTGSYNPPEGVYFRMPGYGTVEACEYLEDGDNAPLWHDLVSILKNLTYEDGFNLRCAPYDWRAGPDGWTSAFYDLQNLIEVTYEINGNVPVAAISLSMGGPYFTLFLNRFVDQTWKDKYIHSFTSLSGVFGGSTDAVIELGIPTPIAETSLAQQIALMNLIRSWGSVIWLLPFESTFGDQVLFYTPKMNYTSMNLYQFLIDAGANEAAEVYQDVLPYQKFSPPGVYTNCIYGSEVPTLVSCTISPEGWNNPLTSNCTYGNGDGTVIEDSLSICSNWNATQDQPVNTFVFPGLVHGAAVMDPRALAIFLKTIGFDLS